MPETLPARLGGPAGRHGWTVKKILDWAAEYFQKNDIENPHLEAEILLAHALGMKRIDLYIKFEKELDQNELSRFKEYVIRRKGHEPSAYITGIRSFMSLDFIVTRYVLIPRPETEILVEAAMDIAKNISEPRILDIGTGSGAVAISIAKYIKTAKVCGTDVSRGAILVAIENSRKHGVLERVSFEVADLFPKEAMKFDIIISNPPYIKSGNINSLAPEIKDFEPNVALDGGDDGLKYYRMITREAKEHIEKNGHIIMETDPGLVKEVGLLLNENGFGNIIIKKDINGLDRIIMAALEG